eukprot:UN12156
MIPSNPLISNRFGGYTYRPHQKVKVQNLDKNAHLFNKT